MFKYIIKRLLISLFVLLGVSVIIYVLVRLMPTDYVDIKFAEQLASGQITAEQIQAFKELYGIGDSSPLGIIKGYFTWVGNMFKGDLGLSLIHI